MESEFITVMKFKEVNSEKLKGKIHQNNWKDKYSHSAKLSNLQCSETCIKWKRKGSYEEWNTRIKQKDYIFQIEICLQFWSYQNCNLKLLILFGFTVNPIFLKPQVLSRAA